MNFWEFVQEENAEFVSHEQRVYMNLLYHITDTMNPITPDSTRSDVIREIVAQTSIYPTIAADVIQLGLSESCGNILNDAFHKWKSEVSNVC